MKFSSTVKANGAYEYSERTPVIRNVWYRFQQGDYVIVTKLSADASFASLIAGGEQKENMVQ